MSTGDHSLELASSAWFRRHGLRGQVRLSLTDDGLLLQGKREGLLLIAPQQVTRLRSVAESSRHGTFFTTRIWVDGDPRPAVVLVARHQLEAYVQTVGNLASRVASLGQLQRLERGATVGGALAAAVLLTPLLLGSLAVSVFVLADDPWYLRFAPTLVGVLAMVAALLSARIAWPRPVADWAVYVKALTGQRGQVA